MGLAFRLGLLLAGCCMSTVKAKALPPRGEAAASALFYEPVKAKTLPPRGEVAASALSYRLRYWRMFGHRVAKHSPRAVYYGPRYWVLWLRFVCMGCNT